MRGSSNLNIKFELKHLKLMKNNRKVLSVDTIDLEFNKNIKDLYKKIQDLALRPLEGVLGLIKNNIFFLWIFIFIKIARGRGVEDLKLNHDKLYDDCVNTSKDIINKYGSFNKDMTIYNIINKQITPIRLLHYIQKKRQWFIWK